MKLRTFTALLLAAIMLFALTACGSQAADDSSSDQQQEQQDGKRDAEADADRIAENFARVARGKKAHSSHWTPSPASLIKASSKRVSPAAAHSSCAVPQIRSLPCDRMPMRSESASASSR